MTLIDGLIGQIRCTIYMWKHSDRSAVDDEGVGLYDFRCEMGIVKDSLACAAAYVYVVDV